MQLSHTRPVASAGFDDPNLVSCVPTDTFGVGDDPGMGQIAGAIVATFAGGFLLIIGFSALILTMILRRHRSP